MPLATVSFLIFLPEDINRIDSILLDKAESLLVDACLLLENKSKNF